jgi:hypothetical protein
MILALALFFQLAVAAPQPIQVPLTMRTCTKTSECEAVPLRCGCCQYQGISKMYVTNYLDQNQDPNCVDQPCNCKPLKLVSRCVKQRCELVGPGTPVASSEKAKAKAKPKKKKKKAKTKKKKPLPVKKAELPDAP